MSEIGFNRLRLNIDDTIVACATPPGRGAISIVRLSGPRAIEIAERVFRGRKRVGEFKSHTAHLGCIFDGELRFERVLLLLFRAPNSYTGEDIVEFHLHGGRVAIDWLIEILVKNGARPAEPGEFTFRALVNGKMDLIQAESIEEIISAQSRTALLSSVSRLEGRLSEWARRLKERLWDIYTRLEASINFPEDEIEFDISAVYEELSKVREELETICANYDRNRFVFEGAEIVIAGPKNAGKSSLFNAIVGENRAIVSDIPGTTRDIVEAHFELDNIPVVLYDTAGLGKPSDKLDSEGQKRAYEKLSSAHLILFVVDGSVKVQKIEFKFPAKTVLVVNKIDLGVAKENEKLFAEYRTIKTSALLGTGIDELLLFIRNYLAANHCEPPLIGTARQRETIRHLKNNIERAMGYLETQAELSAEELKSAIENLSELLGETLTPDLLESIFSRFCIGK